MIVYLIQQLNEQECWDSVIELDEKLFSSIVCLCV